MKLGRTAAVVLGLAAALAAAPATAQDAKFKKWYLGGSVGVAQWNDTCDDVALIPNCEDRDEAYRVFAGYRFNPNFAFELGYANLGKSSANGTVGGAPAVFEATVQGFDYSAVGQFSITENLHAFGRLGAYTMRAKVDATLGTVPGTPGDTNTGFTVGLGAGYDLGFLGLRLEWQRWVNVGGQATGEDTIDLFSVGALLRF